ncbi:MAG: efflux RND transporter permease subunit [Dehalobacterium sp.]
MKIIETSVKRPVTITMIIVAILLLGTISITQLPIDLMPKMELPVAVVMTSYTGAGPEEVESTVTEPLEDVLGTVENVDTISSQSMSGQSIVIVEFSYGTDMNFATLQMREKVDMVKGALPDDANAPTVIKVDMSMMPVTMLGLSGDVDLEQLKSIAENEVQPRLERLGGVASVSVIGGYTREVQVRCDPVKMEAYGIGMSQVSQALQAENMNVASGTVEEGNKDLFIRTMGQFKTIDEIRNVRVSVAGGKSIALKDLADVQDTHAEQTSISRMNGAPSVALMVQKQSEGNTVQVASRVAKEMEVLSQKLPEGVEFVTVFDQSTFIKQSINTLVEHGILGGLLAVIIIYAFLHSVRSTLIIALALPISIIGIFSVLYGGGLTLNMMSLSGLLLGIGHLVDCSIVVLESVFRYRKDGYSLKDAAIQGASEVGTPVIASTLTVAVVFLPILFAGGMASMLFREMVLTIVSSQSVALLVAVTLVPMLCSKYLVVPNDNLTIDAASAPTKKGFFGRKGKKAKPGPGMFERVENLYGRMLGWALSHRKTVVLAVVAVMVLTVVMIPVVGMEFIPKTDSGEMTIAIELDKGTVLKETDQLVGQIESMISDIPEIKTIFVTVGSGSNAMMMQAGSGTPEVAEIQVQLVDLAEREKNSDQVAEEIRERVKVIPGADISVTVSSGMSGTTAAPIAVTLKGDDLDVLKETAAEIKTIVEQVPGTREVESSITVGRPELQLEVNKEKAAMYGLSVGQVASAVRTAFDGNAATKYRTGGEEYDIRVILPEEYRKDISDLMKIKMATPTGIQVSLSDVVTVNRETGPTQIDRQDQTRTATINSQIVGRDLGSVTEDIQAKLQDFPLPQDYSIEFGGENEDMAEAFTSLGLALILGIALTYMVMAGQFESLITPFVIMFTIPTMFVGVIGSLLITGRSLSVTAFIGVIMLVGIVLNNGIVLVDYINVLRGRGLNMLDAIKKAGPVRLRPVLMTALCTGLSMMPLAIGAGEGSEVMAPTATVVVGGLTTSTIFTLLFVPVMYSLIMDFSNWVKKKLKIGSKKNMEREGEVI